MALQLAQPELSRWETVIHSYRVNELQTILQHFKLNKLGKKQELVVRVIQILRTPQQQPELVKFLSGMNQRNMNNHRIHPYQPNHLQHQNRGYNGFQMNNMNQHQMYGNGGAVMSMYNTNSTPKPVRGLRTVVLPFYDPVATILEAVELPGVPSGLKTQQKMQISFSIPQCYHQVLTYREGARPLPRHELQLRFFQLPINFHQMDQPDDFPPNCNVKIDDCLIVLPNIIPTNKPNVEAKRPSRPVNITMNCQPPRDQTMGRAPHKMVVDWTGDKRVWAVGIYVVHRVTADILRDRAQANEMFQQDAAITKQQIIRRMTVGDEDGITMDQVRISLLCPLGKTRMGLPARCRDCTHLQCFDLDLFLKMNEKRPTWKCGICNTTAPFSRLLIDGYFQDMLRDVTDVNEVELLKDGGYKRIQEEINDISDSDDDDPRPSNSNNGLENKVAASSGKQSVTEDDIITLSDDEDEDLQRGIVASVTDNKTTSCSSPRKSQDIEVIDLDDDTPPRPIKAPEPQEQIQVAAPVGNPVVNPSTFSTSSLTPPAGTPISFPSTSSAQQAFWQNNNGNGATTNFNYPFMNPQQPRLYPPPPEFPTIWTNDNYTPFDPRVAFANVNFAPPPQPTLAEALQAIQNAAAPNIRFPPPHNFQRQ